MLSLILPISLVFTFLLSGCGSPIFSGVDQIETDVSGSAQSQEEIDLLEKLEDPDLDDEDLERVVDELEKRGYTCVRKSKDDSESGSGSGSGGSQSTAKSKKIKCKIKSKDRDGDDSRSSGDDGRKGR